MSDSLRSLIRNLGPRSLFNSLKLALTLSITSLSSSSSFLLGAFCLSRFRFLRVPINVKHLGEQCGSPFLGIRPAQKTLWQSGFGHRRMYLGSTRSSSSRSNAEVNGSRYS